MPLPHFERPICEPVELPSGAPVRAEQICQPADTPASKPFVHFHSVCELVLFGDVRGQFFTEERSYPLTRHSVAFVPSMCQHDFELAAGARSWTLLQVDAEVGDALARSPGCARLREAFCAQPGRALQRRLQLLAGWLVALDAGDPLAPDLARLLLRAVLAAPTLAGAARSAGRGALRRLRPAIDSLRLHPGKPLGAERAARLCALSPAYFSRRFKQQVGMSWSDYVRTHRLQLASRRLLETRRTIAAIAADLGYATPSHFGEVFRRRFGMTPREYRRKRQHPPR